MHDHNEEGRIPEMLALLREGRRIALISDAGMPLVSDPGYRLVRAAIAEGLPVGGIPGPNAAMLALVLMDHYLRHRGQNADVISSTPLLPGSTAS